MRDLRLVGPVRTGRAVQTVALMQGLRLVLYSLSWPPMAPVELARRLQPLAHVPVGGPVA